VVMGSAALLVIQTCDLMIGRASNGAKRNALRIIFI
jgi:hypothetical protein